MASQLVGPSKAFVWGSTFTVARSCLSPPSITLLSARWEESEKLFRPLRPLHVPLSNEEHLAAVGYVACYETGLYDTYLVLATNNSLLVGRLDLKNESFQSVGEVRLADCDLGDDGDSPSEPVTLVQECWVSNGPTVVAVCRGHVVVASAVGINGSSGHPQWNAHVLCCNTQRVHFCGDRVLLCVPSALVGTSQAPSSSVIPRQSELLSIPLPSGTGNETSAPVLSNAGFPAGIDPCLVTCVAYVPSAIRLAYNVVYGLGDGKLLCCTCNRVVTEIKLEDSPFLVQFAVKERGRAVLVVSLHGMEQKIIALCAESHREVHSWTRVQQAVLGDIVRSGCDQLVLLLHNANPTDSFVDCIHISHLQISMSNACEQLKSNNMAAFSKALQARLQAGVEALQVVHCQRTDKMEMVRSACSLMQDINFRNHGGQSDNLIGDEIHEEQGCCKTDLTNKALWLQANLVQQGVYGGSCFLIIDVRVGLDAPEGFGLHCPSLLLTSLHGHISSLSSCLSLPSGGLVDTQRLLVSFPLMSCRPPLHVMLAAQASISKNRSSMWDRAGCLDWPQVERTSTPWIYTQWLCTIEEPMLAGLYSLSREASTGLREVCEQWLLEKTTTVPKDHLEVLINAVSMHLEGNGQGVEMEEHRRNDPWTEGNNKMASLSSLYTHDMSLLQNSFPVPQIIPKLIAPKLAEMVSKCASMLLEELRASMEEVPNSKRLAQLEAACDQCFCHLLSSIIHDSFKELRGECHLR